MSVAWLRNRSAFWNILKVLFAMILFGFVFSKTELHRLPALFESISIRWLIFSTFLFLSLTLLKALQYYALVREKVTYAQVLNVVILQNAVSNYLASSAGIASYLTLFRMEHDVKVSRSLITFLLVKMGDLIVLWPALFFSSLLVWSHIGAIKDITIGLLFGIGAVILVLIFTLIFRRRFILFLNSILTWSRFPQIQIIRKALDALQTFSEVELGKLSGRLTLVFLFSVGYFALSVFWYYSTFMVFNFHMDISPLVFTNVLIQLISYFPIQVFGGLGVTETGSLFLWEQFGVGQSVLAPILVGSRILFYIINLIPLIYLSVHAIFLGKSTTDGE